MEKLSKLFFVFLFIGMIYLIVVGVDYNDEIKANPGQTICKYTLCKQRGKSSTAYVKYCINGKLYRNKAGSCPDESGSKIDKYYLLDYSTINPNNILVDFSKEIKDSISIKELESKFEYNYWLTH